MTVHELVGLGRSPYTGFWGTLRGKDKEVVERSIALVKIENLAHRMVHTLSDGERQKAMIAKALAQETPVIFLDEPTGGVDPATRRQFWELIYQAAERGITVFVTTHYMDEAEYCNRISMMVDGKIEALDTPQRLKERFHAQDMDEVFRQLARKAVRS